MGIDTINIPKCNLWPGFYVFFFVQHLRNFFICLISMQANNVANAIVIETANVVVVSCFNWRFLPPLQFDKRDYANSHFCGIPKLGTHLDYGFGPGRLPAWYTTVPLCLPLLSSVYKDVGFKPIHYSTRQDICTKQQDIAVLLSLDRITASMGSQPSQKLVQWNCHIL